MHATLNPKQTDPGDILIARADDELANAHEQITRADEELARVHEQLSRLALDTARHPSDPQARMTTFRPAAVNDVQIAGSRPALGRRALRGFTGLLLAACIGIAALASQSSYGDAAKQMIAAWVPQLVSTSSPPPEKPALPAQPSPPAIQTAAAEEAAPQQQAPQQPPPPAPAAPEGVAPTAAALTPELAQLLQTMAHDLATVGQGIEQLKASQEQLARDNAKTAEQIKATQEQMARVIAKTSVANASAAKTSAARTSVATASVQNPRPKIAAAPPLRPTAAPLRKPLPTLPPPQAAVQPQAESRSQVITQPEADELESSSAPRPPMPVR